MKKILSLILCLLFGFSLFLAGCGTSLSNVTNKQKGIIFNGGSVALVSDYLFYANGFASDYSSMEDMDAYNKATKYASLSRIKTSNIEKATKYKSSKNVETVSAGDLVGYSKTYMFAYGQDLYYVTPNTEKTSENKQAFGYLAVNKIGFNGANASKIYRTQQAFDAEKGKIVALEYKSVAYIMIYDGKNLVTIDITNGGTKVELGDVTSVAFPQENANWNGKIYYTKNAKGATDEKGNEVYSVSVSGGKASKITNNGENSGTIKFIGRIDNSAFYTLSNADGSSAPTYIVDCAKLGSEIFTSASENFYPKEISNIVKVDGGETYFDQDGYVFTANGVVLYDNILDDADPVKLIDNSTYASAKVITAVGTYVYFATTSGIYKVVTSSKEVTTIIDGMTIKTEKFGYTYNFAEGECVSLKDVYFFAQRAYEDDAKDKSDTNVYLYQVSTNGEDAILLGKTI